MQGVMIGENGKTFRAVSRMVNLQVVRAMKARYRLFVYAMATAAFTGSESLAQLIQPGGNNRPDNVINGGVCGANGILSWLTGTKMIATFLAIGLVGYFLGRAVGKQGAQDGLIGAGVAVLGLAAIKAITSIFVAGC